jgi:hypothetical protein
MLDNSVNILVVETMHHTSCILLNGIVGSCCIQYLYSENMSRKILYIPKIIVLCCFMRKDVVGLNPSALDSPELY